MKSTDSFAFSACLVAGVLFSVVPSASAAQRVPSERSKAAPVVVAPTWRAASFPAAQVSRLQYQEMSAARILKLERYNAGRRLKPLQIGIARNASGEAANGTLPALRWMASSDGGSVARIEVTSPVALGLRVGLKVEGLNPRAELRFAGSAAPSRVVSVMTGQEIRKLVGATDIFWTPSTDGETQLIEIYLPAGLPRSAVPVQAPQLSHLLANNLNDFKIIEKIGKSGTCNVDTACRVGELGAYFVSAKNAVARMIFTSGGSSYYCTGTLLADTVTTSQIPYFYTANHCIGNQAEASSLNTFWKYEAATCGSGIPSAATYAQLTHGADFLYSDPDTGTTSTTGTDAALLRLSPLDSLPAYVEFAGWDSAPLAGTGNIIGIHHPAGDVKKVSSGQQVANNGTAYKAAYQNAVAWLSGTTEGGSSGSGLFTADATGYHLRGGLYGGSAECANSGSTANAGNRDYYSRFDVVFPHISQWLAPAPPTRIRVNGSQPRVPGMPAATVPAAATLPVGKNSPQIRVRTRIYEP